MDHETWLYVVQAGGRGGPVKLGIAAYPEYRLVELQVGNHLELKLLHAVTGGRELERALHKELVGSRLRGEWFNVTPEVVAAIQRVLAEPGRRSYKRLAADAIYQDGCRVCGTPDRVSKKDRVCRACVEFAEVRASGADPFEEAA